MSQLTAWAIAAALLLGCGQAQPDVEQIGAGETLQRDVVPVETLMLRPEDHTDIFEVAGLVAADEDVRVASEISGRIIFVGFDRGDGVRQGHLLIRLDDAAVQAQIRRLQATISREKAQLETALKDRERAQQLFDEGVGAEKALDDAESRFRMLTELVKEAEAALEEALVMLGKHAIHAPVGGRIAERPVSNGEYVNPGTPVAHLVKIDLIKFEFALAERDVPRVQPGQELEFTLDAYPGRVLRAPIAHIAPAGSGMTRTFSVTLRRPNDDEPLLLPGMSGRVRVLRETFKGVYLLPEDAVLTDDAGAYVYLVRDGKAMATRVDVVSSLGARAVVRADLDEAAECVILGQHALGGETGVMVRRRHEEPPVVRFD